MRGFEMTNTLPNVQKMSSRSERVALRGILYERGDRFGSANRRRSLKEKQQRRKGALREENDPFVDPFLPRARIRGQSRKRRDIGTRRAGGAMGGRSRSRSFLEEDVEQHTTYPVE
jgi:hypothetical protein